MKNEIKNFTRTKSVELWIEDDIVMLRSIAEEIDIDDAHESYEIYLKLSNKLEGGKLFLIDMGNTVKMSLEARRFYKNITEVDKIAIIIRNPVHRIIAAFFHLISKAKTIPKFFNNIDDAKKWLKE
ncbi:MAG: hypothetical protein ABII90_08970 [Bacteroidota bacterium]